MVGCSVPVPSAEGNVLLELSGAAAKCRDLRALGPFGERVEERGLSDPGLAYDLEEARLPGRGGSDDRVEAGEFGIATDEVCSPCLDSWRTCGLSETHRHRDLADRKPAACRSATGRAQVGNSVGSSPM